MAKKLVVVIMTMIIIINLSACTTKELNKYEASFLELFNTITKVVAYTQTKEEFASIATLVHDNLKEYHQLYDKYNNYDGINNIKVVNDNAGISPVKVDKRIIKLLLYSKEMYDLTGGKVNIALGPVLEIWHEYRELGIEDPENATLPTIDELKDAMKYTDMNQVIIDESASTVFLVEEHMSLDVGAIAKGYATEQVCHIVKKMGYSNFLLSVGGNVRAVGTKGVNNEFWNIGIKDPDPEQVKSLFILAIKDLSLVSSGNYERYYTVNNKQYHHIINPDTLMPAEYFTTVSVICEDSGMADSLSTAIYNIPFEEGKSLIDSLEDTEALWVFHDGTMKYSDNFKSLIK